MNESELRNIITLVLKSKAVFNEKFISTLVDKLVIGLSNLIEKQSPTVAKKAEPGKEEKEVQDLEDISKTITEWIKSSKTTIHNDILFSDDSNVLCLTFGTNRISVRIEEIVCIED
jgi:hypothetical protein